MRIQLYVLMIVAMLIAEATYTTPNHIIQALKSPEIQYSIRLSLFSCAVTTILALWVSVPIGYLMSRHQFRGKVVIDGTLFASFVFAALVVLLLPGPGVLYVVARSAAGKARRHELLQPGERLLLIRGHLRRSPAAGSPRGTHRPQRGWSGRS